MFGSSGVRSGGRGGSAVAGPAWLAEREWLSEPGPGEFGHAGLQVHLAQREAYWSAVSGGQVPPVGPNSEAGLLDAVSRAKCREARADGEMLRAVSEFALHRIANPAVGYDETAMMRTTEAELGFELRVSAAEAADLLHLAMTLTRRLPRTFAALEAGVIDLRKVRAIVDETLNLTVAQCAAFEDEVLPEAPTRTVRSLRDRSRRVVERLDADAVRKRREAARADRSLYLRDEPDGMATVCLYVPVEQARAIIAAVNARIPAQRPAGDDRLVGARRVDEILAVLGAGFGLDLTAVADTAVPAPTAEQIARLDRGAETYVPSEAMKAAIRARDRHCRFPGCRRPGVHCDIDHTIPFNLKLKTGGRTVYVNLGCFCRFHHQVKQMPGWSVTQDAHGLFTWTDPGGRVFLTRPPPPDGEEPPEFWAPEAGTETFPF